MLLIITTKVTPPYWKNMFMKRNFGMERASDTGLESNMNIILLLLLIIIIIIIITIIIIIIIIIIINTSNQII